MKYVVRIDGETLEVEVKESSRKGSERHFAVDVDGQEYKLSVESPQAPSEAQPMFNVEIASMSAPAPQARANGGNGAANGDKSNGEATGTAIVAPMTGKIVAIHAKPGAKAKRGDVLFILEAMKMENSLQSTVDGVVGAVVVSVGDVVKTGDALCYVDAAE